MERKNKQMANRRKRLLKAVSLYRLIYSQAELHIMNYHFPLVCRIYYFLWAIMTLIPKKKNVLFVDL